MPHSSNASESYARRPCSPNRPQIDAAGTGASWSASIGMHELLTDLEALMVTTSVLRGEALIAATARLRERCAEVRKSVDELGGG